MREGTRLVSAVLALACGCTNDLMKVEFVSASASGVGGHWFIGAEWGETIELMFKLDPDDISDPAGWSVEIDGPDAADTTVALTGRHTIGSVTLPQSDSLTKREDETFTFHLIGPDGSVRESRQWEATIANPGAGDRAWLWGAFWTTDGERLIDGFTKCSSKMGVVAYVGGNLGAATSVRIEIIDVDLVSDDEVLESNSYSIKPETRIYQATLDDPCATENGSGDTNNVDPKFTATLIGSDGRAIDSVEGPEID